MANSDTKTQRADRLVLIDFSFFASCGLFTMTRFLFTQEA
jgi:hypothetical protein